MGWVGRAAELAQAPYASPTVLAEIPFSMWDKISPGPGFAHAQK